MINKDVMAGKWKQIKGEAKIRWSRLTGDEIDEIDGRYDKLIGKLQERYGYDREEAEKEAEVFFEQYR